MSNFGGFMKTTVVGGIVFLVPVVIVLAVLGKAFEIMTRVAEPLAEWLPIISAGDILFVNLLVVLLILLFCFSAGLLARTRKAKSFVRNLETRFLDHIPVYAFIKGMTDSVAEAEQGNALIPVYVRLDDYSQIAFEVERLEDGSVVVYLPGAPNPWSGSVCVMSADRVATIDASMLTAAGNIRHLGKGSSALLKLGKGTGDSA